MNTRLALHVSFGFMLLGLVASPKLHADQLTADASKWPVTYVGHRIEGRLAEHTFEVTDVNADGEMIGSKRFTEGATAIFLGPYYRRVILPNEGKPNYWWPLWYYELEGDPMDNKERVSQKLDWYSTGVELNRHTQALINIEGKSESEGEMDGIGVWSVKTDYPDVRTGPNQSLQNPSRLKWEIEARPPSFYDQLKRISPVLRADQLPSATSLEGLVITDTRLIGAEVTSAAESEEAQRSLAVYAGKTPAYKDGTPWTYILPKQRITTIGGSRVKLLSSEIRAASGMRLAGSVTILTQQEERKTIGTIWDLKYTPHEGLQVTDRTYLPQYVKVEALEGDDHVAVARRTGSEKTTKGVVAKTGRDSAEWIAPIPAHRAPNVQLNTHGTVVFFAEHKDTVVPIAWNGGKGINLGEFDESANMEDKYRLLLDGMNRIYLAGEGKLVVLVPKYVKKKKDRFTPRLLKRWAETDRARPRRFRTDQ